MLYPLPECPFTPTGLATHTQPSCARIKVIPLAILPSYCSPRNMLLLHFRAPSAIDSTVFFSRAGEIIYS